MLRKWLRRLLLAAASLVGVAAVLWLARAPILTAVARLLTVEDAIEPADVILMFPGEVKMRPTRVAELYHAGLAPTIVIPRSQYPDADIRSVYPNPTDRAMTVIHRLGVPRDAIVILDHREASTDTRGHARMFRDYVARNNLGRVIAVTSTYHTRRARWALRRALQGLSVKIMMTPVGTGSVSEDDWWQTKAGLELYFVEYVKWLHNYFHRETRDVSIGLSGRGR